VKGLDERLSAQSTPDTPPRHRHVNVARSWAAILVSRRQTASVGVSRRQLRNGTPCRRAVSWLEHRLLFSCHESLAAHKERVCGLILHQSFRGRLLSLTTLSDAASSDNTLLVLRAALETDYHRQSCRTRQVDTTAERRHVERRGRLHRIIIDLG
jgi:hypothetical protein